MTIIEQASALTDENAKNKFPDLPFSDQVSIAHNDSKATIHLIIIMAINIKTTTVNNEKI